VAIANLEVGTMKEFESALAKADRSKPINILYRRAEWVQYAVIRPSK
jgi:serine protease Do